MRIISAIIFNSPILWASAGLILGLILGVTAESLGILTLGMVLHLIYMWRKGAARQGGEGWLFASGPVFLASWIVGFMLRGIYIVT